MESDRLNGKVAFYIVDSGFIHPEFDPDEMPLTVFYVGGNNMNGGFRNINDVFINLGYEIVLDENGKLFRKKIIEQDIISVYTPDGSINEIQPSVIIIYYRMRFNLKNMVLLIV